MSVILGLNAFHAGASAALLVDGQPVAAIAEERLNRVKYYARFPTHAIRRCLDTAGLDFKDIDAVAFGRDSSANRAKKIEYALRNPTRLLKLIKTQASRGMVDDLKQLISRECEVDPASLRFAEHHIEHHLAHVASAYFISPWENCAGFSLDGSGDFVTCMMADCEGTEIDIKHRIYVPHSLGSLYTMICEFIGYQKYGDEGKVMGLAPLGKDAYHDIFEEMVILTDNGVELNPKFFVPFGESQGLSIDNSGQVAVHRHYSDEMVKLFGEAREPYTDIPERDQDLAFGLQRVFEKGYMHLLNLLHQKIPHERIAMSGGCVLNSVANGKMFDETPFTETCIQPAAGDEGLALGAALYVSNSILKEGKRYVMENSYLGPEFTESEMEAALQSAGVAYRKLDRESLLDATATEIEAGNVVGWFQGRMEWGPRALGNRSILAHPGRPDMKDILNARIKHREAFRPFAPSVLVERQAELFEKTHPSPFMLHVYEIKPEWRERLCAVNHVDNTGRLQSVSRNENPLYYDLIQTFEKRTGIPVILNTSFNENEPIVCAPEEAIDCYTRTKMDVLAMGPFFCKKG
ncbi:MAG: carbamoyltransferase [Candidatus Omnitrophica bacterium]|nr:carbamoyltransferase [Candidatus Omnitrophota bacterium]